ncbi:sulfite exporter TauE/SafE family protein [Dolichospermum sp. ST_sed1]|nr:sulfite exporter TauE/SafE family protein [Dolichospermum sp. ST_sed1]MDD1428159.1 sulfite exporter TauE/SafE family protein [Dolichospermum sp. ST_sed9]MDD1434252.1 sulfite exporter TauE/SafE family protein [Dolichospermum sp. ST_sed6]MDD1443588.1 sulfite exporter TauE/SafE family protein [Dolichospermum sp. ST_sed3]MDD1449214.1 sulfite exporter TauE/SafE family protein [Dolichospermum sp. ST_sed8]MDD1457895.1 sulfite exporter TauE/SafE family protein [Dolichospermum sp. ST_sed7]MDD146328
MLDLLLIMLLGFLGSFGHCFGMCGPLTVAFSLSKQQENPTWQQQLKFHTLLNLGRMLSYALVGAGIGAIGSVLVESGQLAGVGSDLRRWIAIITGMMLIWFGLGQVKPDFLPHIPLLHPILKGNLHNRLSAGMMKLSAQTQWWTPALLGMTWGLMPCGFLYAAQIKAAATGNLWEGAAIMLAFGMGTLPIMLGVGVSTALISKDQRSQLFRLGGWVTMIIGTITLLRTGDTMTDYSGHASLFCLILSLIARPVHSFWSAPLRYRRALGVGAFVLAGVHTIHHFEHALNWNFTAVWFLPLELQWGMSAGAVALVLMIPAACTSFDFLQKSLGKRWRQIHLLTVPALLLSAIHTVMIGSHYLGALRLSWQNQLAAVLVGIITVSVLLVRSRYFWLYLHLEKFYVPPNKSR